MKRRQFLKTIGIGYFIAGSGGLLLKKPNGYIDHVENVDQGSVGNPPLSSKEFVMLSDKKLIESFEKTYNSTQKLW